MSTTVSGNFLIHAPAVPGQKTDENTPTDALRRLHLTGLAGESYNDVVKLGALDLETAARELDSERQSLQSDYTTGSNADVALQKIEGLLGQVSDLVDTNAKPGVTHFDRAKNQKQIDSLLDEVQKTADDAGTVSAPALDGSATMYAASQSLKIDTVALATLGRVSGNGHTASLSDLLSHESLDTSRHGATAAVTAKKSIAAALAQVHGLRVSIETFQRDAIRPRLGDIATTLDGLYAARSDTLTSTTAAMQAAVDIRTMLLGSAALAAGIGADGWDKARVLALVTPAGTTTGTSTSSSSTSGSATDTSSTNTSSQG